MPEIKYVEGDLFESLKDDTDPGTIIIPHVCNDQGAWGKGFVLPLAKMFPDAQRAYQEWHRTNTVPDLGPDRPVKHFTGNEFGLGQVQFVRVMAQRKIATGDLPRVIIANMVGQTLGGKRPLSYKYLTLCMEKVQRVAKAYKGGPVRIVFPLFGSALAGGDWNFIENLVQDYWYQFSLRCHYLARFLDDSWTPPENGIVEFETRP